MNKYTIELIEKKQQFYMPIYAFSLMELEIMKAYIKTHLKIRFIRPLKFPTNVSILFDKKSDSSLCLFIDYQGLNNFHNLELIFLTFDL